MAALHLTAPRSQRLRFLAGQHVTLSIDNAEGEYYVASCPVRGPSHRSACAA
jgi:CDP-4-dehydro-6-deoxyglucose reductase